MTPLTPMTPPQGPRAATGEQYVITRGPARAQIGQVAAVLREFSVAGVHYTERWPDEDVAPMGCGIVLMPWPNRVDGGRWTHDGVEQQLDLTEPKNGNAIHGLLRYIPYRVAGRDEGSVTLAASIYPQHGYPFTLDTTVTYSLTDDGLHVEHAVTNVGSSPAPFGCGTHPYLRVGEVPTEELTLTMSGRTTARVNERMIPISLEPVAGTAADLSGGVLLADLTVDAALTDFDEVGGRFEHRLTAPDGTGLLIWSDAAFRWAQVYAPPNFPAREGQRKAIAVEPMTCGVNAFNTGRDVLVAQPGETWRAAWGLSPF